MKRAVLSNFSVSIGISAFGLIGSILMARALGPGPRGEVAAAVLWPTLLVYLGSIGTYQAFIFFYSRPRNISLMWGTCLVTTAINSVLSVSAGLLLVRYALQGSSDHVKMYSYLLLISIPFSIISQYIVCIIQAKQKFKSQNVLRSIFPTAYLLGLIFLYLSNGISFESVVITQLILNVLQGIVALFFFSRLIGPVTVATFKRKSVFAVYKYGSKVWIGDLSQGMNTRLDQIVIANLFSPVQMGFYVVAYSVASFTSILANSYRSILLPKISSVASKFDMMAAVRSGLKQFSLINLAMAAGFAVAGPVLIILAYGPEFRQSVQYLFVLLVGYAFLNMKTVYATVLQGMGHPLQSSLSEIGGFLFLIVFAYPVSSYFGIHGIIATIAASYLVQYLIVQYFYRHQKLKLA